MVNRPPPKAGARGKQSDDSVAAAAAAAAAGSSLQRSSSMSIRHGLEWSLRSMHKIDTSAQHFLNNYYGSEESTSEIERDDDDEPLQDQTAYEIFKQQQNGNNRFQDNGDGRKNNKDVWASLHAPLRIGVVDGKKVVFELRTDVKQKPATSRSVRLHRRRHVIVHSDRSRMELRIRFWLMHFRLGTLTAVYLAAFIALNAIFALFFYFIDGGCCDDSEMTYGEIFAFSIQTSTTIGYGSFSPVGTVANFLVVVLSYASTLMNTLFAGLLFTKFVTPVINIQFSEVMTICNVNGVPCLSVRLGNADGHENPLTDINVRLTYSYQIPYTDHKGDLKYFHQTEELQLLSNRQHGLLDVWTLRHVLDESSPLFGLNFDEHPANKIYIFTLSVDAVQEITKSTVNVQTEFELQDILIGHNFRNQVSIDVEQRTVTSDYSKMSETEPYPVWYPAKTGVHETSPPVPPKTFGPI